MKHQSIIEIFLQTLNHNVLRFQSAIDPPDQRLQKKRAHYQMRENLISLHRVLQVCYQNQIPNLWVFFPPFISKPVSLRFWLMPPVRLCFIVRSSRVMCAHCAESLISLPSLVIITIIKVSLILLPLRGAASHVIPFLHCTVECKSQKKKQNKKKRFLSDIHTLSLQDS